MHEIFTAGKRYDALIDKCIIIEAVILAVFFYIMSVTNIYPSLSPVVILILFVVSALVISVIIYFFGKYQKQFIRYEITSDCLVVSIGKKRERYPWINITAVYLDKKRMKDPLPMVLEASGQTIVINQYVDSVYGLANSIMRHVRSYAIIDPQLISMLR